MDYPNELDEFLDVVRDALLMIVRWIERRKRKREQLNTR